ncbi:unnamed protein product [Nesidiocoris tenuis]|uniref:Ig-like domain-containing protein n=1 Tax=Nesidiocoris tenuis TaxID=355587 RepID=A0A6H5HM55_9HEMI|nr:unnamed protein product [Nesidiocoris tenuis]
MRSSQSRIGNENQIQTRTESETRCHSQIQTETEYETRTKNETSARSHSQIQSQNGNEPRYHSQSQHETQFPPMLSIPHQLVSAPIGYNVTLECFTEAHPTSLNYWTRGDGQMIYEGKKYHIQSRSLELPYKTQMKLTIYRLRPQDLGTYKCVAKNPRGETDGSIRLYGNKLQTSFNTIEKLSNKEREHLGKVDQFGGSNAPPDWKKSIIDRHCQRINRTDATRMAMSKELATRSTINFKTICKSEIPGVHEQNCPSEEQRQKALEFIDRHFASYEIIYTNGSKIANCKYHQHADLIQLHPINGHYQAELTGVQLALDQISKHHGNNQPSNPSILSV